ncbi:Hypothetical predicted protein [Scomber scombrus]|uniref:Uncharacterized protein n=1 Tax=Scomber scombrus TaxID=13677 RepID=A0AAV1QCU3_SCOSC
MVTSPITAAFRLVVQGSECDYAPPAFLIDFLSVGRKTTRTSTAGGEDPVQLKTYSSRGCDAHYSSEHVSDGRRGEKKDRMIGFSVSR